MKLQAINFMLGYVKMELMERERGKVGKVPRTDSIGCLRVCYICHRSFPIMIKVQAPGNQNYFYRST